MTNSHEDFGMIVAFDDPSPSYVHGFETGMIWAAMERGDLEIERGLPNGLPIHEESVEVVRRMAKARGYDATFGTAADGWIGCHLAYAPKKRPTLRVV